MKFIHTADLHARLLKHHKQYREILSQFYEIVKKKEPNYIIVCGDIFHSKINVSNESIVLVSEFLQTLANITETFIILGNHDLLLRSPERLDSISPIIKTLNHPNLHFIKKTQQIELKDNFVLNVLSILDKDNWKDIKVNKKKNNIALYHGPIKGSITDTGWVVDRGDLDLEYLTNNYNYAFLGDIHAENQRLDKEGKVRYCGSLIQQNHAETQTKGFLSWDIKDKDNFICDFIPLDNPSPFVSVILDEEGKIPQDTNIPKAAKVRVITNSDIPYDIVRKAIQNITLKFKPESVTFLNRGNTERSISSSVFGENSQEDLRDIEVQERLIKEYLKDYDVSSSVLNKVLELNKKYKVILDNDGDEEIKRNVYWKIKTLEWDNLFNYGEGNIINFDNLKGTTGIFGKSFSGKTSAIDTLSYTIFDAISKNERKSFNIINQNREWGQGKAVIETDEKEYHIERRAEKYKRFLKGKTTEEAKVNVEFYSIDSEGNKEILNGSERDGTNKNIRRIFGTMEDFLLTNMSSQFEFLSFINEGSTKRKEILAKFLDLELFESKYKMAKEDSLNTRGALKRLENRNYAKEIFEIEKQLGSNRIVLKEQRNKCDLLKETSKKCLVEMEELDKQIKSIPIEVIDYNKVKKDFHKKEEQSYDLSLKNKGIKKEIKEKEEIYSKMEQFIKNEFDIDSYRQKKEEIIERTSELKNLENTIKFKNNTLELNKKKTLLLKEVPCGDSFPQCKFIKDAYEAKGIVEELEKEIEQLLKDKEEKQKQIDNLEIKKVEEYIKKYESLVNKKSNLMEEISNLKTKLHKDEISLYGIEDEMKSLQEKIDIYNANKYIIENLEVIINQKKDKEEKYQKMEDELENCEKEILKIYKKHGMLEQQFEELNSQKTELETLREEYSAYELFETCFHSDGISYEIIKKKLPYINGEIAKVLANVVPFQVFLEANGNKLDIFIKHPKYTPRSLQMGSGAEKTISALAIRCAFIKIGTLPRANILILDEPATTFDDELLDGFTKMLEVLKEEFETIIIISHLNALKDVVDKEIVINKKEGYALINE